MELAGRVPSRWSKLQTLFQGKAGDSQRSDDKAPNSISAIRSFRRSIINKCSRPPSRFRPRILVTRNLENYPNPLIPGVANNLVSAEEPEPTLRRIFTVVKVEVSEEENEISGPSKPCQGKESTGHIKLEEEHESDSYVEGLASDHVNDDDDNDAASNKQETDQAKLVAPKRKTKRRPIPQPDKQTGLFPCSKCEKQYSTLAALRQHRNRVHVPRCHKCTECPSTFKERRTLVQHSLVHKDPSQWKFKCSQCDKSYKSKVYLQNHIAIAHTERCQLPCDVCGKGFFTTAALKKHRLRVHVHPKRTRKRADQAVVEKMFQCSECGKKLGSSQGLKHHLLTHKGPSAWKYQCAICGHMCAQKSHLDGHMFRKHNKDVPVLELACKICGEKFSNTRNLAEHVKSEHVGKGEMGKYRLFPCTQCDRTFFQNKSLKFHVAAVHDDGGGESHNCSECGKTFATERRLKRHALRHTDLSTGKWECLECGKKCYDKLSLHGHMISKHKDVSLNQ